MAVRDIEILAVSKVGMHARFFCVRATGVVVRRWRETAFPSGPEKNTRAKESPLPAVILWGIHLCITVKESRGQRVLAVQQMENVTLASSRN